MRFCTPLLLGLALVGCEEKLSDNDGDGFESNVDCDDSDIKIGLGIPFSIDFDGDGFGGIGSTIYSCSGEQPTGFVPYTYLNYNLDCDDNDATINPDADEVCADEIDNDCDGLIDADDDDAETITAYRDLDGDGFGNSEEELNVCELSDGWVDNSDDCHDLDATINPDATEICDGLDNDCDGAVDIDDASVEGATGVYLDADMDGFGTDVAILVCEPTDGWVANNTDCNDSDANVNPDASEVLADSIDNNCDAQELCHEDLDDDGFGSAEHAWIDADVDGVFDCELTANASSNWDDCNDDNALINPDVSEICDGVDNDCDGLIDDLDDSLDTSTGSMFYADVDLDGYGSEIEVWACEQGPNSDNWADCDDSLASSNPMATDIIDGIDQNCDGVDGTDSDQDGHASTASGGSDCDDSDLAINSDAQEICDGGIDNDCDGLVDDLDDSIDTSGTTTLYEDYDEDGFGSQVSTFESCASEAPGWIADNTDCDDWDMYSFPGAAYMQSPTACLLDPDGDGWSTSYLDTGARDCDNWDANVNPDAAEVCDGIDNNCDGDVDEGLLVEMYPDLDGDGFGSAIADMVCEGTTGYVDNWSDCDDSLASSNPMATDMFGDNIDQNCDGVDGTDYDGDGFISTASGGDDCDDFDAMTFLNAAELDYPDVLSIGANTGIHLCMKDSDDDGYGDADVQGDVIPGSDCEDEMPTVNIDGVDTYYDGIDGNCDGMSDFDQDMDGDDIEALDCDGDGIAAETECDFDGDGEMDFIAGTDCDDLDVNINGYVGEIWFDGIDQNCDDLSDFDQDMDGDNIPEIDCFGILATECDVDGDGVIDFIGGGDCDDWDENLFSIDFDGDGITACDGDCDDSLEDHDGDGIADSSYTYPGAAFNEIDPLACLTDVDGDGYAPMASEDLCLEFVTHDIYGDGWNGNELRLYENGIETGIIVNQDIDGIINYPNGEYNNEIFCLQPDTTSFDIEFISGQYSYEISFEMFDQNGELLVQGEGQASSRIFVDNTFYFSGNVIYSDSFQSGMDCDDADALIHPDADNDGDGFFACIDDCDDYDLNVYSGAPEVFYDGLDQACDDGNDFDQDGDGDNITEIDCNGVFLTECDLDGDGELDFIGGTDCDDSDSMITGFDEDQDGMSACDGDCDDYDSDIFLGAQEVWYDGVDQSCLGLSDYDQDGDGLDSFEYGGTDCDDLDANIGATDDDGDGFLACVDDCNDDPNNSGADQYPGNTEIDSDGIDQDCDGSDGIPARTSCVDHYNAGYLTNGIYPLIHQAGHIYDAYCDMTTDLGGWTRIIGTDSFDHDFGLININEINLYMLAEETVGVSYAFEGLAEFSQIMIKKTSGTYAGEFAAYSLVESISGYSVLDIIHYCSAQPEAAGDDLAWDGPRVLGYTSEYSGTQISGTLMMESDLGIVSPSYFFMCGVNESSYNTQSVMAFSDSTGDNNTWGSDWVGDTQRGAMWSFWNDNYYAGFHHIISGHASGLTGYKTFSATNAGSYEIYIR